MSRDAFQWIVVIELLLILIVLVAARVRP